MASATVFQFHVIWVCVGTCVPAEGVAGAVADTVSASVVTDENEQELYDHTYLV